MDSLLDIQNVTIKRNHKIICQNLSFQIKKGQCYGILGLNGFGKTTLLHTLAGLLPVAAGDIFCEQVALTKMSRKNLATKIGLLLQEEHHLFSSLVCDVVLSGRYAQRSHHESIKEIMEYLRLTHFAQQDILRLSGGEKKRVSIARILYQSPRIFLLDEPMNQLDPIMQHHVMSYFKNLCQQEDRAALFSSHDVNFVARHCDQVILFMENNIVVGDKKELLTEENLIKVYTDVTLNNPVDKKLMDTAIAAQLWMESR